MNKYLIAFLISALFFLSCAAPKQNLQVENIKYISNYKSNPVLYNLPRTVIGIDVELTKKISVRGPFAQYSSKFFHVDNVIKKDEITWEISNIVFSTYPKIDSNQIYVIDNNKFSDIQNIALTKEGFLISINKPVFALNKDITTICKGKPISIITDKNEATGQDTVNNTFIFDSVFLKVPLLKKQLSALTPEEQARELAEEIYTLRDDRNALLVGEADGKAMPEGESMKIMLQELNRIENQYLSMFSGVKMSEKYVYHFEFEPGDRKPLAQKILFRFDPTSGILSNKNVKGEPVIFELTADELPMYYNQFSENQGVKHRVLFDKPMQNGIFYRIPHVATVRIFKGKETLTESELSINQYGTVLSLSKDIINAEPVPAIEFYPETGAIKSISKPDLNPLH